MRTPRAEPRHALVLALLAVAATAVLLTTGGKGAGQSLQPPTSAAGWRGLVGSRPRVALPQRVIVVLKTQSLAQRVAAAGGIVSTDKERGWTKSVLGAERLLISRLALQGVTVHPDYTFSRVLAGFSAQIDAGAIPIIERDVDVQGVYPVRVAYPATLATRILSRADYGPGSGHRPDIGEFGIDGRGVTIALLDTGVDAAAPYLRGRVQKGIDIVGGSPDALAATNPADSTEVERHGTQMAGLLVGAGGPAGLQGVATGASVLPVRVAGWQSDSLGRYAIYARSDQIIAGLDRAVDPNDDGDAHDGVRIALIALAEPFAAFTDGPEAQAVAGALDLDTLVVAPAGNDGEAAAGYGDVSAPGAAPAALTVGALDTRVDTERTRIVLRAGLTTLLDGSTPLVGAATPTHRLDLRLAVPRGTIRGTAHSAPGLTDFFSRTGVSLVAGRAALVPAGTSPESAARRAAAAGASAVLLYGAPATLPAGGLGLDDSIAVPVVSIPESTAHAALRRLRSGQPVAVAMRESGLARNVEQDRVASFSSSGLAFDGGVKPDIVAPGVALATADPGSNPDGSPRFVTINGSSAAAAVVAGAAALLAQARPSLGATAMDGLLVGAAQPLPIDPVTEQGAGLVDVGAATAGEVAASPATLALGRSTGAGWRVSASFTLTNLSTRGLNLTVGVRTQDEGAAAVDFHTFPSRFSLRPGHSRLIRIKAITASAPSGTSTADGTIVVAVQNGSSIRVPWAIAFGNPNIDLVPNASLSARTFGHSDTRPALLSIDAGRVLDVTGRPEIEPLSRLDVVLKRSDGTTVGLLARLRDVLPGHYTFGLTGRGPDGQALPPGGYSLRIIAYRVQPGPPTRRRLDFTLQ